MKLLEFSYDGIWITDGNGKILFANSANADLLGVSKSDLEGKTTEELQQKGIFLTSAILDVVQHQEQVTKVCNNPRTNLTVLATATPVFDASGRMRYIFNNVRDITALHEMQVRLQDKEEIIRRQNKQLETLKIRMGVGTIIANSKSFQQVVDLAQRTAKFDGATVLILGESGTGKEIVSELIVNGSPRSEKPFLRVNCGAIPESLIESELFGYERGAFTGADAKGRKGIFEAANGGTVFLDEIGDLPLHMQVKFLRVLQQKRVVRVGGTEAIPLDVRIIAATNKNLKKMVQNGAFREDLYYRLNVVPITIPPLRERREDIWPLVQHFLTQANRKYHTRKVVSSNIVATFERYSWPGNVRELENLMENLVITTSGDVICLENLPEFFRNSTKQDSKLQTEDTNHNVSLKNAVGRAEYEIIEQAILQYGSIRKAANALGVNPSTIVRKRQQSQISKKQA